MDEKDLELFDFGEAIKRLKDGLTVARKGWNMESVRLYLVPAKTIADEDGKVEYDAYIAMKTVRSNGLPWSASHSDILAEDWIEVE